MIIGDDDGERDCLRNYFVLVVFDGKYNPIFKLATVECNGCVGM